MVKPLTFKGDKKAKKRKRPSPAESAESGQPKAETEIEDDDTWVSADVVTDISGPVVFVLPTDPPATLACDPIGKVFTIPVENIVDGNPSSAEPHNVRQVWVANRVAGTENFRFRGAHGKYLSCDKFGIFSATSEAISPLESFVVTETPDAPGTFQVQTLRETFLTIKGSPKGTPRDVRGDATEIADDTTVRIRMQARFKPRIKASKEERAKEKVSRKELEAAVGRTLEDDEVRRLKRARREGDYHELLLDLKVKNKHDKYS